MDRLIFELSTAGKKGYTLPNLDIKERATETIIDENLLRSHKSNLPEVAEFETIRHFRLLADKNHHIEKGFYPLGSCTMKYNPKVNEVIGQIDEIANAHPKAPANTSQGILRMMYELQKDLGEISGFSQVSLQPVAGAHGELTALLAIRAYFDKLGQKRKTVIIPDSAHGTNPASAIIAGFSTVQVESNSEGIIDVEHLKEVINEETAAIMITNPNTLGIFEKNIKEILEVVHSYGALAYMDGANLNALMGIARPGDMGFDVMHFNLHKTFSTPHGGGGPGSGPIGVNDKLATFLPSPVIDYKDDKYIFVNPSDSIGKVHSFYGNFAVAARAYIYIKMLGAKGLRRVSENAIINANYLKKKVHDVFDFKYDGDCLHEFVASGSNFKQYGVKTLDIAKRLLDYGFHAPTIYFPLIVPEALMIEPTETESKETLDNFAEMIIKIAGEAKTNPELLKDAPVTTPVKRLDEGMANRQLNLIFKEED